MAERAKTTQEDRAPGLGAPAGCLCSGLRRAARAVSQIYDAALAPHGLTNSQFFILATLQREGPVTMQRAALALGMDRTTLTRALGPLGRDKLTGAVPGADARERRIALLPAGKARLKAARPAWLKAQKHIIQAYGESRSALLLADLDAVRKITDARSRS